MKSTIRKFKVLGMLSLPLAAIALAVFLLSGGTGSIQQAHAQTGPDMSLSATCNVTGTTSSTAAGTLCSENGGSTFTVSFNVVKPPVGGYGGYDLTVSYSGQVNYKAFSLVQPYPNGTGCGSGANFLPQNTACFYNEIAGGDTINSGTPKVGNTTELGGGTMVSFGAQSTNHPANSTYSGAIASMQFVCKASGNGTITLVAGVGNTDLSPGGSEAANESLNILCKVPPTPVPATATSTPPPIPRVFKQCTSANNATPSTLCNVFLTRQGPKVPPTTCAAGNNAAILTEQINIPISTVNSKGEDQTLGAYEFEVRYDSKNVCVFLTPSAAWQAGITAGTAACTIRDDSNSTLKGIAQIGCVSIGKGHKPAGLILATITVKPQPELYSQIRPNQDNGIAVQLLNQGCNLADEQGHAIPVFSCEDADLTFRFLEGDVDGPDCDVDVFDTQQVAFRWGVQKGSLLYNSFMDLSPSGQVKGDGRIDIKDVQFVFGRIGSTCANPWPAQAPVNPKA